MNYNEKIVFDSEINNKKAIIANIIETQIKNIDGNAKNITVLYDEPAEDELYY